MKHLLILFLSLSTTSQAFAALDLDYGAMVKRVNACKKSIYGCTAEQKIEIARFNGGILDAYELGSYLSKDTQRSVFVPLSLKDDELITLAAATSLGVVAFRNDEEIMDVIQNHKTQTTEVKRTFGRARPNAGLGAYSFFNEGHKSFYSGHATQAFTLATVIAEMYKEDYPIVPYIAYGFAAITGFARVHANAHWASDVIIGGIAGHLITKLAMNAMKGNRENRSGVEIFPSVDPLTGVTMLNFKWTEPVRREPMKCSKLPEGMLKVEACIAEALNH